MTYHCDNVKQKGFVKVQCIKSDENHSLIFYLLEITCLWVRIIYEKCNLFDRTVTVTECLIKERIWDKVKHI